MQDNAQSKDDRVLPSDLFNLRLYSIAKLPPIPYEDIQ
jgi:hypothetical protein